ncbi:MAG TPA: GPP34 family phosphoprotein [Rhodanobacteraceae bacterium]|nr:GPP34 family phosphoprotein [Rhodanobacteraceae bacterium]
MELLAEDLLLLALDDAKGTVPMAVQPTLDLGLAGAMIADMAAQGRLRLDKNFWGEKLSVTDASATDNRLFNDALAAMAARPDKSVSWWVHNLSRSVDGLRARLLESLVGKGTLEQREERILLLFHHTIYPERDGRAEHDIRQRMDAVLLHGEEPEPHMLWLLQLAMACHIVDAIYPSRQRAAAKKRIKALAKAHHDDSAPAVAKVIEAQQQAVMMAIMVASVAATSAACSSASASC